MENILRYFAAIVRDYYKLSSGLRTFSQVVLRASAAAVWIFLDPSLLDTSSFLEWALESTYGNLSRIIFRQLLIGFAASYRDSF